MKSKSLIALTAAACLGLVLTVGGCRVGHRAAKSDGSASTEAANAESRKTPAAQAELSFSDPGDDGVDFPVKEELRQKFQLKPGSVVNVHNINGRVTVETADTDTAEILIVRSAKKREDLDQYRQIKIQQNEDGLSIRVENDRKSLFSAIGTIPEGRQRVILKLPRKTDFESSGVNGNVTLAELQGRIELRGVNGQIKASRVAGPTEINGVNGGIDVTFAPLKGDGIEINGVNGNIDLRFEGEVNADLNSWGVNGQINHDLPDVERRNEEPMRGRLKARIGTGGTQIRVGGVNGNVSLMKAEKGDAKTAKVASK